MTIKKLISTSAVLMGLSACSLTFNVDVDLNEDKGTDLKNIIAQAQARTPGPIIERKTLVAKPLLRETHLSPTGDFVAFRTADRSGSHVYLANVATGEISPLKTSNRIRRIFWSTDGKTLFIHNRKGIAGISVTDSDASQQVVTFDRKKRENIFAFSDVMPSHFYMSATNPESGHNQIIEVSSTGSKRTVYSGTTKLDNFLTDTKGMVRFIQSRSGDQIVISTVEEDGSEKQLYTCHFLDMCALVHLSKDNELYLKGRAGSNARHLFKYDIKTGAKTPIHQYPKGRFDIDGLSFSMKTGKPLMVSYAADMRETFGMTHEAQSHIDHLKQRLQSQNLTIEPTAHSSKWSVTDANPMQSVKTYYVYDLETKTLTRPLAKFWQQSGPSPLFVERDSLSIRKAFWYPATDGFMLQGYVTLPNGSDLSVAPLVVKPHGGPWNRATGDFNLSAQFLASRGYIVFEPNFRASTGMGLDYMLGANKDFGKGRVQQDITDGLDFLLNQGIGDPERLGIFGHSFGGFSALNALTFTPDLFQVGIATAPPADLPPSYLFTIENRRSKARKMADRIMMKELAVDLDNPDDVKRLYDQSPKKYAANIKKPLYIWAGGRDPKVNIENVRAYVKQLQDMGKDVTLMTAPKEPHGPRRAGNKIAYLYMLEKALHDHLGGKIQADISPRLKDKVTKSMEVGEL